MTDNNSSWPPPETPGWPPNAENTKNGDARPATPSTAARLVLNILCFCLSAGFSFVVGAILSWVGLPWLMAVLLWLILLEISRLVKTPWVKAAFSSGAWGAGVAALCWIAFATFLHFAEGR